jgi:hypothetical protein
MKPGIYTFYNQAARCYLSCSDRTLTLSSTPFFWDIKQSGKNGFFVYAHRTELLLDIDNAWVRKGNAVKVRPYTGHQVQLWSIAENSDGTCTILHSADPRYCLGFDGKNAVLQFREQREPMQRWKVVDAGDRLPKQYLSVFGRRQVVELQLPMDIERTVSKARLQRWADQLEIAYGSFQELTGFRPFLNITVEAYKPSPYENFAGWVFPDRNTIFVNPDFLRRDLAKMNYRRSDWNFCVLHEMGHLFDNGKPWNFEADLMTDLKVAYVLEVNNAAAAPAEFDATTTFYGADIAQAYARLGRDFSRKYDIFGCTKRFLEIKDQIGWMPFRDTFHYLQKNCTQYINASAPERLNAFIRTLSHFSGQNIRARFSDGEWNSICREISR